MMISTDCGVGTGVLTAAWGFEVNPGILNGMMEGRNRITTTTATKISTMIRASRKKIPPLRFEPGAMFASYIKKVG
jgi:hypothetical protein